MSTKELTLIVASTNRMGIGKSGSLPWTDGLKKDMAYFARVTKKSDKSARDPTLQNAVIMGRKTWDSIPASFRPLKDRVNIVVSRRYKDEIPVIGSGRIFVNSFDSAVQASDGCHRVFVIGGAQIYEAALASKLARRILLTRVLCDFDFDTRFPLELAENGTTKEGWRRVSHKQLTDWTNEKVSDMILEENGTKYMFEMWEKNDRQN
ncbi:Dihydrofolate reductase [Golovinomyces cichoracearum]|uniref:Dihydrofolate reductase n=1 Tax=Golovinomyces cichoracearum TaxID=62708 RepID=A0A420IVG0_9PEZI|nr:Dihydrofolate reductase [Golovinomyces cichoracearum]